MNRIDRIKKEYKKLSSLDKVIIAATALNILLAMYPTEPYSITMGVSGWIAATGWAILFISCKNSRKL